MSDAIKPCPFCGVVPQASQWGVRTAKYVIGCNAADAACWVLPWFVAPTRKKAIERWNTRAEVKQ